MPSGHILKVTRWHQGHTRFFRIKNISDENWQIVHGIMNHGLDQAGSTGVL